MSRQTPWVIRTAVANDAHALPAIENSAALLFREMPALAWLASGEDMPVAQYQAIIEDGATWVALDASGQPIGFLAAAAECDALHIWELGVRTEFQRRGLGRNLVRVAIEHARSRRLSAVTLTTFRHVPWNAPFYQQLGFQELAGPAIDERLASLLLGESERGLPTQNRCAMRLKLGQ